jgi:hypothetical protein
VKPSEIAILLMLLALLAGLLSLIRPQLLGMKSRGAGCALFLFVSIALFLVTGFLANQEDAQESASDTDTTTVATSDSAAGPQGVTGASPQPAADTTVPTGPVATLRADTGRILVSTRRDNFDRPHLVAELPNGTEVEVLGRETTPGGERCRVRTTFAPIVTGWVRCEQVVE